MAAEPRAYTRLPGRGVRSVAGIRAERCRLWLGRDHLLYVANQGFSEDYRRFYFKDIQAIVVRRTPLWLISNTILGSLLAVLVTLAVLGHVLGWDEAGVVLSAFFAGCVLIPFLVNLAAGPTCAGYLYTAVQTQRIYSMNRLRTTRKVLDRVRPLIEAVQGTLEAQAVRAPADQSAPGILQTPSGPVPLRGAAPARRGRREARAPLKHCHGRFHEILFCFLLLELCHRCVLFFVTAPPMGVIGALIRAGVIACTIGALATQYNSDILEGLRVVVFCTLGYIIVDNILVQILTPFIVLEDPRAAENITQHGLLLATAAPLGSTAQLVLVAFSIAASGSLGFTGLVFLSRFRTSLSAPSSSAAPEPEPAPPVDAQDPAAAPGANLPL